MLGLVLACLMKPISAAPQTCGFLQPSRICPTLLGNVPYSFCDVRSTFASTHCSTAYTDDTEAADLPSDLLFAKCLSNTAADCCLAPQPKGGFSLVEFVPNVAPATTGPQTGLQSVRLVFNFVARNRKLRFAFSVDEGTPQSGEINRQGVKTCTDPPDVNSRSAGTFFIEAPLPIQPEEDDDPIKKQTIVITVQDEASDEGFLATWAGTFEISNKGIVTTTHVISETIALSGTFLVVNKIPSLFDDSTLQPSTSPKSSAAPSKAPTKQFNDKEDPAEAEGGGGNGLVFIIVGGSVAALVVGGVLMTVIRRRKSGQPRLSSSLSSSPHSVSSFGVGQPPNADGWSVAADNPLRPDTVNSASRVGISSRFKSLFLPMWGDRANLRRSSLNGNMFSIQQRNEITSSKLLSMGSHPGQTRPRVSTLSFLRPSINQPTFKKKKKNKLVRTNTPDVL
jgi:hypothetical protein